MNELKKLKDKVSQAGARVARAKLNLEMAERDLEDARKHVLTFVGTPMFDTYLTSISYNFKIQAIKEIRALTYLGLKEAKDIVDAAERGTPTLIKANLSAADAEHIRKRMSEVVAVVDVRKRS